MEMTIGERARKAIYERAEKNGTSVLRECAELDLNNTCFRDWGTRTNPSAFYLAEMCRHGYDIVWILTGETYGCEV